jgi:hypothetical protein
LGLKIDEGVLNGGKSGGIGGYIMNGVINSKVVGWMFDNNISMEVNGLNGVRGGKAKLDLGKGGDHYKKLFNGKSLFGLEGLGGIGDTTAFIANGLGGGLVDSLGNQITGFDFMELLNGRGRLISEFGLNAENLAKINALRETFIKKYAGALGLKFTPEGLLDTSLANINNMQQFFKEIYRREYRTDDYFSLAKAKVGHLERYAKFISRIQSKYVVKVIRFAYKPIAHVREAIQEKVNNWIASGVAAVFGDVTGGLGYAASWAIKMGVSWVLNKVEYTMKKAWDGIKKLDYTYAVEMIEESAKTGGKWLVYTFAFVIVFPILIVAIIFTPIFSTLPAFDPSQIGDVGAGEGSLGFGFGDTSAADCLVTSKSLSEYQFMQSTTGGPGTAYTLMEEMQKGFWCYWNHSPSYDQAGEPDYFNEVLFQANPSPGNLENCYDCLFWCTFLPWKSGLDTSGQARADKVENYYIQGGGHYVSDEEAYVKKNGETNIRPGDIVFIKSPSNSTRGRLTESNHVGVVWAVTPDAVVTLHSNSGEKAWAYPVDYDDCTSDGKCKIMDNQYHIIQGFGGPGN